MGSSVWSLPWGSLYWQDCIFILRRPPVCAEGNTCMFMCFKCTVIIQFHVTETRMDDFYVLGSNLSFPSSLSGPMGGSDYQLCGKYLGTPPVGQISRVTCQPQPITARYVYIQVNRSVAPANLELCEVWVYSSKLFVLYDLVLIILRWSALQCRRYASWNEDEIYQCCIST